MDYSARARQAISARTSRGDYSSLARAAITARKGVSAPAPTVSPDATPQPAPEPTKATPVAATPRTPPDALGLLRASGFTEEELSRIGDIGWAGLRQRMAGEGGSELEFANGNKLRGGQLSVRDGFIPHDGTNSYHYDGRDGKSVRRIFFTDMDQLDRNAAGIGHVNSDIRPTVSLDYDPETGKLLTTGVDWYSQSQRNKETSFTGAMRDLAPIVLPMIAGPLGNTIAGSLGTALGTTVPNWVGSAIVSGGSTALQGGDLGDVLKSAAGSAATGALAPKINDALDVKLSPGDFNPGQAIASGGVSLVSGKGLIPSALSAAAGYTGAPLTLLTPAFAGTSTQPPPRQTKAFNGSLS